MSYSFNFVPFFSHCVQATIKYYKMYIRRIVIEWLDPCPICQSSLWRFNVQLVLIWTQKKNVKFGKTIKFIGCSKSGSYFSGTICIANEILIKIIKILYLLSQFWKLRHPIRGLAVVPMSGFYTFPSLPFNISISNGDTRLLLPLQVTLVCQGPF